MKQARKVYLRADQICDRKSAASYMTKMFHFPEGFVQNLSSMKDCLEEVYEDTDILLSKKAVKEICQSSYAFQVLLTIGTAADENPHIQIHFTE